MSKAALATFMSVGRGVIVNISSISGLRGTGTTAYGASKAAVNQLTRDMALSYGANGIRVNAVVPGGIETPMSIGALSPESRRAIRLLTPLHEQGTPWDVAAAVFFLAGDEARYITGALLPVDGGASAAHVSSARQHVAMPSRSNG
jgi:NAD(P)-dependent dehydrogenase (short-subunit alcohol dehydrogenase family)